MKPHVAQIKSYLVFQGSHGIPHGPHSIFYGSSMDQRRFGIFYGPHGIPHGPHSTFYGPYKILHGPYKITYGPPANLTRTKWEPIWSARDLIWSIRSYVDQMGSKMAEIRCYIIHIIKYGITSDLVWLI